MKKQWADASHVGKITISVLNKLSAEFHKEIVKEEKNFEILLKLAGAMGYQSQIYGALQKNHEISERLDAVEKTMSTATAESLAMGQSPIIIAEADLRVKAEFQ